MDPLKITSSQMARAMGVSETRLSAWYTPLRRAMVVAEIVTPETAASFLANVSHETGGLRKFVEALSYSAERIIALGNASKPGTRWRSLVPRAAELERNPYAMAEAVYGGRMGNGPEGSGDGWRFRGRGPFMLTGRNNYREMTMVLQDHGVQVDLESHPDTVAEPENGSLAAAAFWIKNELSQVMATDGADAVRRRINGGSIGLAETRVIYQGALRLLQEVPA